MERKQQRDRHSQTGDRRGWNLSGHRMKPTERWALTHWRPQRVGLVRTERNQLSDGHSLTGDGRRDLSGHGKKVTERQALTNWRPECEGPVRTQKQSDRATGTHFLETAEERTCQDTERNRPSDRYSRPGDHRVMELSGHRRKPTEKWALMGTHILETTVGGTGQDMERK